MTKSLGISRADLKRHAGTVAAALMALRAATVAVHFAIMLWLAQWLGLAGFGSLAHAWAMALVASTLLAAGGPLVILRQAPRDALACFCRVGILHPAGLAAGLAVALHWLEVTLPWESVLAMGLALALCHSVASVLRVWGSQMASMFLRDGVPIVVLGLAALGEAAADAILLRAAGTLVLCSAAALLAGLVRAPGRDRNGLTLTGQASLWLSSLLGMAQAQADLVVAGLFLPAEIFGIYALLRRVANLVALPVSVATWACAGPVASAFAQGDGEALARASTRASAIAWYPALALLGLTVVGTLVLMLVDQAIVGPQMIALFAVLLGGAILQAYWGASYPVAHLGPAPLMGVEARALALGLYGAAAWMAGSSLDAAGHALVYTVAMTAGSLHLWRRLRVAFAVDTSARVLWRRAGAS